MANLVKSEPSRPPERFAGEHESYLGERREGGVPEFQRSLSVLWRRKYFILVTALLIFIPAAFATFFATPQYLSTAVLQIDPNPTRILPFTDLADSPVLADYELYMKTQDEIIRTETLTLRVAERLKEENRWPADLLERFEGEIGIRRVSSSQLLSLSYVAPDPDFAAKVVNLYAEELIKKQFEDKQQIVEKASAFLKERLESLKRKVEESEQELVEYARDKELLTLDSKGTTTTHEKFSFFAKELAEADSNLVSARARYENFLGATLEAFPDQLRTENIQSLTARLLYLEQDLVNLTSTFGDNWPTVIEKRRQLDMAEQQLVREKEAALKGAVEQEKIDFQLAQSRRDMLAQAFASQKSLVNDLNKATIPYNILKREVETNRELYDGLLGRLKEAGITPGLEFGNIHIVERGRPNLEIYSPSIFRNLSIAAILGMFLGVGLAFLVDYFDNSIKAQEELEEYLGLPNLSVIPSIPELFGGNRKQLEPRRSSDGNLPVKKDYLLPAAISVEKFPGGVKEAYQSLVASLLLSCPGRPPQRIVITSAVPKEGKTLLTAHLGITLAQSGASTVLVECDMRKPRLALQFGVESPCGLSLFLSGGHLPEIMASAVENLYIVCSGPQPPNPSALLNSGRMIELLDLLAKKFKFVLVDTPPVLTVADARMIVSEVDGVILAVRSGRTPRQLVRRASSHIQNAGGNLVGTVLTFADSSFSGYGRYSRHYADSSYYTDVSETSDDMSDLKKSST